MGDVHEVLRETTPFILSSSASGTVHVFDALLTDDLLILYEFLETEREKEIAVGAKRAAFLNDGLIPYTCHVMSKAFFSAKPCWKKESQREKNIYLSILKNLDMDQNVVLDVAFWSPAVLDPETFLDGFASHKVTFPYNQKMRTSDLSSIRSIKQGAKTLYQYPLPQKGTPK